KKLQGLRGLPGPLKAALEQLPRNAHPMDVMRTGCSVLGTLEQEAEAHPVEGARAIADRLMASFGSMLLYWHHYANSGKRIETQTDDDSIGGHYLHLLHQKKPSAEWVRAMHTSLILYAEHEFNASTFTARVVCSTESDLHSAITAAIGALKGRLHGGANEKVMDLLRAAGGPETAEEWVRDALARKERVMGFGHRVYKTGDVRAGILKEYARRAAEASGDTKWEETAAVIERVLASEKNLFPNLDWPAGRLYYALGLEVPLYTPIFVMSRVAGWSAHVMEQLAHNRLIRPRSRYTGPEVKGVKPLAERG
ncbi:MAG TPA: citrate/2-methylcitrate synthase, partial [Gemmataceae bacterium]|nr:citrate/2-methylcitrate synthase [Gemmataceae bacterium]